MKPEGNVVAWPQTYYRPEQLQSLATLLGASSLTPAHARRLQRAATIYLEFFVPLEKGTPEHPEPLLAGRRKQRKALLNVANAAKQIVEDYEDLVGFLHTRALGAVPGAATIASHAGDAKLVDVEILQQLERAARLMAKQIKLTGAEPKKGRWWFVCELAEIFRQATGSKPTPQHDVYNAPSGSFFHFVQTAMGYIDGYAVTGIDADVKSVLKLAR